nr:FadR/GntR family transcriptional regulator [Pelagibacterium montanilacus]
MQARGSRDTGGGPITLPSAKRKPHNFHAQVIHELGTAIVSGRFGQDQILPGDAELTEQFGVSRTVLREALKTLSAKGMVEARARVGTRVLGRARWNMFDSDVLAWHLETGLDIGFVDALAEVRMALEPEAAALAAARRTDQQAERLSHWLDRMAEPGQSANQFAVNDFEFHKVIAEASGNPFMLSLSAVVEVALTASFAISSPVEGGEAFDRAVRLHRSLCVAIVDREPEMARAAMRQAIQSGVDRAHQALGEGDAAADHHA